MDVRSEDPGASCSQDVHLSAAVKNLTLGKHSAEVLLNLVKDGLLKSLSGADLKKFVLDNFRKASIMTFTTPENAELCTCINGFVDVLIDLLDQKQKVVEVVGQATSWLKLCRF